MSTSQNAAATTAKSAGRAAPAAVATSTHYKKSSIGTLVFSYAVLIMFVIFAVYPVYFAFLASVRPGNQLVTLDLAGMIVPKDFTLENYNQILIMNKFATTGGAAAGQVRFWIWLGNSLFAASLTAIASMAIALPTAFALSRFRFYGRRSLLIALFVLQSFPGVLFLVPYFNILRGLGLYGNLLGLVVAYSAGGVVFTAWNMKGYFDTIPVEIEESALIDGCNVVQSFFRVLLPLSLPAIAVTLFFNFQRGWTDFFLASVMVPAPDALNTLPVALNRMAGDRSIPWGQFASAALLIMIPSALLFAYVQRFLQSGLTVGGVKG